MAILDPRLAADDQPFFTPDEMTRLLYTPEQGDSLAAMRALGGDNPLATSPPVPPSPPPPQAPPSETPPGTEDMQNKMPVAPMKAFDMYAHLRNVKRAESNGDPMAKNPLSSAKGHWQ